MTDPLDSLALVAEVLTWVGLLVGAVLLAFGLARLSLAKQWTTAVGVIVDGPSTFDTFRWFGPDGEVHESTADLAHGEPRHTGDDVTVYFDPRHPSKGRLDSPANGGKALRTVGWILLGVGAFGALASLLLLFV